MPKAQANAAFLLILIAAAAVALAPVLGGGAFATWVALAVLGLAAIFGLWATNAGGDQSALIQAVDDFRAGLYKS